MGALFAEKCFASSALAADAFFSSSASSLASGSTTVRSWFEKDAGVWIIRRQEYDSGGVSLGLSSAVASVPQFGECDASESFNDGMAVGWLLVGLMLVAWSFIQIKRLIR